MMTPLVKTILTSIIPYFILISANCEKYSLDPILISSQIRAESNFNPKAISPVGAIGLMQIMPDTAEWLGFEGDEELLVLPALNIRLGCYYDRWLKRYWARRGYDGGMLEALMMASYNAGQGRVRRSIKMGWGTLPKETQTYVERIFKYRLGYLIAVIERMAR